MKNVKTFHLEKQSTIDQLQIECEKTYALRDTTDELSYDQETRVNFSEDTALAEYTRSNISANITPKCTPQKQRPGKNGLSIVTKSNHSWASGTYPGNCFPGDTASPGKIMRSPDLNKAKYTVSGRNVSHWDTEVESLQLKDDEISYLARTLDRTLIILTEKVSEARKAVERTKPKKKDFLLLLALCIKCSKNLVNTIYILENETYKISGLEKPKVRSVIDADDCGTALQLISLQLSAIPHKFQSFQAALERKTEHKCEIDARRLRRIDLFLTDATSHLERLIRAVNSRRYSMTFTADLIWKILAWLQRARSNIEQRKLLNE